jgi:hypothetical protein
LGFLPSSWALLTPGSPAIIMAPPCLSVPGLFAWSVSAPTAPAGPLSAVSGDRSVGGCWSASSSDATPAFAAILNPGPSWTRTDEPVNCSLVSYQLLHCCWCQSQLRNFPISTSDNQFLMILHRSNAGDIMCYGEVPEAATDRAIHCLMGNTMVWQSESRQTESTGVHELKYYIFRWIPLIKKYSLNFSGSTCQEEDLSFRGVGGLVGQWIRQQTSNQRVSSSKPLGSRNQIKKLIIY